jgi:hypothetical protein
MAVETAPVLPLNGWTLVAVLHHRPGRPTVVETIGGAEISMDAWSRSEGWCEHCRTRRARATTYLLRDQAGRLAQVGANCLVGFTGHPRPLDALGSAQPRRSAHRALRRRSPEARQRAVEYIDTRAYLSEAVQAVFDSGFVPAAAGTRERPATWAQAALRLERITPPSARAYRRATKILTWAREGLPSRGRLDDFQRRLVTVLAHDRLTRRELAVAAAAVHSYHTELRRQIAARKQYGEHIGKPGDAVSGSFQVRRVARIATAAGPVQRHSLRDELGRAAIWDSPDRTLPVGRHRLRATVAGHVAAHDRPLTILSNCEPADDAA